MKPLELQIFHNNETTTTFDGCDIEYSLNQCDLRPVLFFQITAISPYYKNDEEYCMIYSNGDEFISNNTYEEVKGMIGRNGIEIV